MKLHFEDFHGLKLVTLEQSDTKSVSMLLACTVGAGSEPVEDSGISHFIEHTVFRGTLSRSHHQIKYPIEKSGGFLNAYTSRTTTVYYCHIPDRDLEEAFDILFDIYLFPLFSKEAVELERSIILEEIRESLDEPTDILFNNLARMVWGEKFGKPILGYPETVRKLTTDDLRRYHERYYSRETTVVVVAGAASLEVIEKIVGRYLDKFNDGEDPDSLEPRIVDLSSCVHRKKDINQIYVALFKPVAGRTSEDSAALEVFNTILGSGMSSLLFSTIREEKGLVYSIGSDLNMYRNIGGLSVYASTSPKKFPKLMDELRGLFHRLVEEGVKREELEYGKSRMMGKLKLSVERTLSNAFRLLDDVLTLDTPRELDNILARIESITLDEVGEVVGRYLKGDWAISVVIPESFELEKSELVWRL
ncbi:MAG: insulinase family protein [Thermotogae bacterium]|nr:insulinase family protein [Thermotogota bacterium]